MPSEFDALPRPAENASEKNSDALAGRSMMKDSDDDGDSANRREAGESLRLTEKTRKEGKGVPLGP